MNNEREAFRIITDRLNALEARFRTLPQFYFGTKVEGGVILDGDTEPTPTASLPGDRVLVLKKGTHVLEITVTD